MSGNPFLFLSKAETLKKLSEYEQFHIPRICAFTVQNWRNDREMLLNRIGDNFNTDAFLAVRSSCRREDSQSSSGAGAFQSVLDVPAGDSNALAEAIDEVIASYGNAEADDQVLVQPMIENPAATGVIMTRALADGAPYYVINYDDESGKTDTVTGGSNIGKTVYVYRGARREDFDSPRLASFVELARNLEEICQTDLLDIEFCLDADNVLHLLQVRPICAQSNWPAFPNASRIERISEFVKIKTGPTPGVYGQRSILGVMPDWNPAEMIGILPRPLAASLYRVLITSEVWAQARARMGYYHVVATELMPLIFGRPYIDVRASFNSLLPKNLDQATGEALINAWLERLENNPQLHDKVEFEIAQTAFDFTFEQNLRERYSGVLSSARRHDFKEALRKLTITCLDQGGTLSSALDAVSELRVRQAGRPLPDKAHHDPLAALPPLLAECRKYGTMPFSILARHAFIAESLLRSAVGRGALSPERLQEFKLSVQTISGEMSAEFGEVCEGKRDSQTFMRKYGHLRPGSYDILSPRYADRANIFGSGKASGAIENRKPFLLSRIEKKSIELLLDEARIPQSPEMLFEYARRAIAGREYAKFIFSRNLSDVLEILAYSGQELGFDREAMSFLDMPSITDWLENALPESPREYFERRIAANRELFSRASGLKLGYLIRSERDVYIAPQHRAAPNYVGCGSVHAPIACLNASSDCDEELAGKIVCIENADPGFDWIFTRGIAGLITRFGGANSHMAIRCAEYGLPAAIGVGERLYDQVRAAKSAFLEPASAILKPQ